MAGKNSAKLDIEGCPWEQVLVEADALAPASRPQPRDLQVEEVLAGVITELLAQVTLSICDLDEGVLPLVRVLRLEGI